jgi:hypothetical protein
MLPCSRVLLLILPTVKKSTRLLAIFTRRALFASGEIRPKGSLKPALVVAVERVELTYFKEAEQVNTLGDCGKKKALKI